MKFATITLLLIAGLLVFALLRRRTAAREAEAEALARARSSRRTSVPAVSSNLKGVTASQTIKPLKPRADDDQYVDDR